MAEVCNTYGPQGPGPAASETSFGVNLAALLLSAGAVFACCRSGITAYVELFLVLMASLLVSTVLLETLVHPKTCALRRLRVRRPLSGWRVLCRETGLVATFGAVAFAYWLIPLFSDGAMLKAYYPLLRFLVPLILIASVPYFCVMDRLDPEEEDPLCRVGRAILTRRRTMTRFELGNFVRSWTVKAFWFSIMQPPMIEKIHTLLHYRWEKLAGSPMEIFLMAATLCFVMDLAYASTGYVLGLKMFNSQIRSAEPTVSGWLVAILCYWPFWGVLFQPYLFKFDVGGEWLKLFVVGTPVWWIWGGLIILLNLLYSSATVAAGVRFSNLTYRGLWNTGPYRLTKHPAYVFKGLSWWLVYAPFLLNSGAMAVKCTLLLVAVDVLYFLRARTEERHLSHYPEYVAYALEMNRRSIFRWCAKIVPALKYRPPDEKGRLFSVETVAG